MDKRRVIWRILGIIGLTLGIVGAVVWGVAKGAIDREQSLYWFTHTFSGSATYSATGMDSAYLWQWIGVALIVIGVGLVVAVSIAFTVTWRDQPHIGGWPRSAAGPGPDVATASAGRSFTAESGHGRLEALVALHDRGALNDEEFAAAKRRLLGL